MDLSILSPTHHTVHLQHSQNVYSWSIHIPDKKIPVASSIIQINYKVTPPIML